MKQIVPFNKKIEFNTRIHEITSISLEHSLKTEDKFIVNGEFMLSGEYRINNISVNKEKFNYNVPFNIELDNKYNTDNIIIDIDDFYYNVVQNQYLEINIDVLIDGLLLKEEENIMKDEIISEDIFEEEYEPARENVGINHPVEKQEKISVVESEERDEEVMDLFKEVDGKGVPLEIKEEPIKQLKPIFDSFDEKTETFVTYHVHIVREEDNVESICIKYNITKEELSNYNKIEEIKLGDKIIVPAYNEEKNK